MFRKMSTLALVVALVAPVSLAADGNQSSTTAPAKSGSKRAIWTIIGAGAGFAAGLFIGLNQFDDATNSDRKVWTTAIVGAAAGGLAGNLLSRSRGPATQATTAAAPPPAVNVPFPELTPPTARRDRDAELLARIRSLER